MIDPQLEALRQALLALPKPDIESLRRQLSTDLDSVRRALAKEMRKSGSRVGRRRQVRDADMGELRRVREAHRDALRIHDAKAGNILRERHSEALQNAVGWLVVLLAEVGPRDTAAGLIGIAARRCLQPLQREPEAPEDRADAVAAAMIAALAGRATVKRSWDWIDYTAAREALSVQFRLEVIRGKRSAIVATVPEQVESWLSDCPAVPDNARPTPIRQPRPERVYRPASCRIVFKPTRKPDAVRLFGAASAAWCATRMPTGVAWRMPLSVASQRLQSMVLTTDRIN